jgi:Protein phosphatase 2C
MSVRQWCWIGACAIGSSHVRTGAGCQDSASCLEVPFGTDSVLIAIVSDGAGSAEFSAVGSRIVVEYFARSAVAHLSKTHSSNDITAELVRDWLDDIRNRIYLAAEIRKTTPRQMAATLMAAIVYSDRAIICHVGDGACVLRRKGSKLWEVPSWPAHGEYASSTYFITDDPEPKLAFASIDGEFLEVAVFSDGIERLALDFGALSASGRFFDPMFAPLTSSQPGRDRVLDRPPQSGPIGMLV